MHELALTTDMIDAISERLSTEPGARVRRVVLQVGRLSAVLPDSMRFCFEICSQGTVAEGAAFEIEEIPGRGICRGCGAERESDQPYAVCDCGGADWNWISGNELRIKELEVI